MRHQITQIATNKDGAIFKVSIKIPFEMGWIERVKFSVLSFGKKDAFQMKHVKNEDNYATTTQIRAISDAMYILDNVNKNYRLCTGRSTDNSQLQGDVSHTVKATVHKETKSVFEIIHEFDEELSEINASGKTGSKKDT